MEDISYLTDEELEVERPPLLRQVFKVQLFDDQDEKMPLLEILTSDPSVLAIGFTDPQTIHGIRIEPTVMEIDENH